ncbi:MAG: tetratricopeptide repeat protein [Nitrospirota bacterium]
MKKLLTLLWIIIIGGAIFIGVKYFSPESSPTPNGIDYEEEGKPEETTLPTIEGEVPADTTKSYTEYIEEGDIYYKSEEYSSSINSYTQASIAKPNSTEPLLRLGDAYLKDNDPKSAQAAFEKAQLIDENSTTAKVGVARSFINQRNIEIAKDILWEMSTQDPLVKYYTAVMLILYKDFDGSKNLFTELVGTDEQAQIPEEIKRNSQVFLDYHETFSYFKGGEKLFLQTMLAKGLTDVEEYDAAIPLLFDVINEKNNYRDAWIVLGYAYLNTDKVLDAIDAFTQAKALDENKPETLFFLGLAYFANDEIEKAVFYIEQADNNGYEPKDQIDLKLGDLYLLQQEYSKSAVRYEDVIDVNKSNIGVFIRVVWLNIDKLGDPEKALKYAYIALEEHPEEAMSYNLVGWSLTALENYTEAKNYLAKAIEIDPELDAAALNLGWFYEKQGLITLAKEYYKRAYNLGQNNSIAGLAATRYNNLQVNISAPNSP